MGPPSPVFTAVGNRTQEALPEPQRAMPSGIAQLLRTRDHHLVEQVISLFTRIIINQALFMHVTVYRMTPKSI